MLVTTISPDKTLVINGVEMSFDRHVKVYIHNHADVRKIDSDGTEKAIGKNGLGKNGLGKNGLGKND